MNSFRWVPIISRILSLLFVASIFLLVIVRRLILRSKDLQKKFLILFSLWLFLLLTFFIKCEEVYAFELGELLEDSTLLRDPQQFIALLYYQAVFWSLFILFPLFLYNFLVYFSSALTFNLFFKIKTLSILAILSQTVSFIVVYRWVFPDWLLALNLFFSDNSFYSFEPDRYRVYMVFFEELLDFALFSLGLSLFYYFSFKQSFFVFWKHNRKLLFLTFFICSIFLVQQVNLTLFQFLISFIVFDFIGFRLFLRKYLDLWKLK